MYQPAHFSTSRGLGKAQINNVKCQKGSFGLRSASLEVDVVQADKKKPFTLQDQFFLHQIKIFTYCELSLQHMTKKLIQINILLTNADFGWKSCRSSRGEMW